MKGKIDSTIDIEIFDFVEVATSKTFILYVWKQSHWKTKDLSKTLNPYF